MPQGLQELLELDRKVVELAREVKVLSSLGWPPAVGERFLAAWEARRPELPRPPEVEARVDPERLTELRRLSRPAADHPVARFVARTAESYWLAGRMLRAAGTPEFAMLSAAVYGQPSDHVAPGGFTSLDAARHFVATTGELVSCCTETEADYCLTAQHVAGVLQARCDAYFVHDPVRVVIDPALASKAAAGAEVVRIRGATSYSPNDLQQLIHHEAFVHTATLLSGRKQPLLTCLGLGAPRTTATQEGLATFSELISTSIDLARLRRLALRVEAIQRGLDGADFIEVFRFFLDAGQTERESYHSAARVFRGGDVRGRVLFTKDGVYMRGLLRTHAFLHTALAARKVRFLPYLFAGRLTWGDVLELEPVFEEGLVAPPRYVPAWVESRDRLAAYLAFSNLTHGIDMERIPLPEFAED